MSLKKIRSALLFLVLPLGLLISSSGCDAIASALGIDEVKVPTSFANSIAIEAGAASVISSSVALGSQDYPDVFDVKDIKIDTSKISYTANASASANKVLHSGTILFVPVIDGLPFGQISITIQDDVITEISPNPVSIGGFNQSTIEDLLGKLDESPLNEGWQSVPLSDIVNTLNTALKSLNFDMALLFEATGDLDGTLTLEELTIGLDF